MKRGAMKNEGRDEERVKRRNRDTKQKQPEREIQLMWECEKKQERREEKRVTGRMSVNEVGEVRGLRRSHFEQEQRERESGK